MTVHVLSDIWTNRPEGPGGTLASNTEEETLRRQFAKMQLRSARGIKGACLENSPEECSLCIPTQICIHFIV